MPYPRGREGEIAKVTGAHQSMNQSTMFFACTHDRFNVMNKLLESGRPRSLIVHDAPHQEIGEEKIIHYNHRMQWIMVYMTRYWISTLHKTYSRDYNGLSFPHQFPDGEDGSARMAHIFCI